MMNDYHDITDEQLRLATSRSLPADAALDPDTAALREAFVSLGRAIEAVDTEFDEAALIENLNRSCLAQHAIVTPASKPTRVNVRWGPLLVGAALAASVLFAVVRIVTMPPPGPLHDGDGPSVAQQDEASTAADEFPVWFDPLDYEIASAQEGIHRLTRGRGVDGSLSQVNDELTALSLELFQESL